MRTDEYLTKEQVTKIVWTQLRQKNIPENKGTKKAVSEMLDLVEGSMVKARLRARRDPLLFLVEKRLVRLFRRCFLDSKYLSDPKYFKNRTFMAWLRTFRGAQ